MSFLVRTAGFFLLSGSILVFADVAKVDSTSSSTFPRGQDVSLTEMAPHIGVQLGLATPEGDAQSSPIVTIEGGFQPYIPFAIGGELGFFESKIRDSGGVLVSQNNVDVMLRGSYNFGGKITLIKHSYVGLGLGAIAADKVRGFVAPIVGFDAPAWTVEGDSSGYFTLGANAKYAAIFDDNDNLIVSGALKYWY